MSTPTRVLIVLDSLANGGAERVAVELACKVDRRRFQPLVVVTRHSGLLEGLLREADVPFEVLGRRGRLSIRPILRLHKLARGCDVIHSHKFGSNVWAALVSRTARRPLITHEHNWAGPEGLAHRLLHRLWIGPRASRVVAVSDDVVDTLASFGVRRDRLVMVPNGVIPMTPFDRDVARDRLGVARDDDVIGIIALLRPVKAHDVLLRAFAQLVNDERFATDTTLCVIGDGDESARLEALAAELGIAEHVVWAGFQLNAAQYVRAFDVSVLCSHTEGMPLSILEAMSAEVPVVASAVGSIPELLADGAGVTTRPGDPKSLADGITSVLTADDDSRRAMVARARGRVEQEYSHARSLARIEAIYDDVVPPRNGPSASPVTAQPDRADDAA